MTPLTFVPPVGDTVQHRAVLGAGAGEPHRLRAQCGRRQQVDVALVCHG